jgi:hypothetical protein|tara:strand:- start:218 stop:514 length:297 start_codon:yes stop_codon:yes gene_type:complete
MQTVEENLQMLYDEGKLNPKSDYNSVCFAYWYRFDSFGQNTIKPSNLTPCESITRAWRLKFRGEKGDEEGVKEYVQSKKNNDCDIPNCTCKKESDIDA